MRRDRENQFPFSGLWPDPRLTQELKSVSKIFDGDPANLDLVSSDLCDTASSDQWAVRQGLERLRKRQAEAAANIVQSHREVSNSGGPSEMGRLAS